VNNDEWMEQQQAYQQEMLGYARQRAAAITDNGMRADRRWHEAASAATLRTTAGRRTLMTKPHLGSSDQADAGDGSEVNCQVRI
jgi:hypothetical protein